MFEAKITTWKPESSEPNPFDQMLAIIRPDQLLTRQLTEVTQKLVAQPRWIRYYQREGYCFGIIAPFLLSKPIAHGNINVVRHLWLDNRSILSEFNSQNITPYHGSKTRITFLPNGYQESVELVERSNLFDDPLTADFIGISSKDDRNSNGPVGKITKHTPFEEPYMKTYGITHYQPSEVEKMYRFVKQFALEKIVNVH